MSEYSVSFIIKDWVEVKVDAENEKDAKEKAQKIIDKNGYNNKSIEIIDGQTDYCGIRNNDILNKIY